jgi:hypothetical protein
MEVVKQYALPPTQFVLQRHKIKRKYLNEINIKQ